MMDSPKAFRSKITLRHLPPEMTLDELKEEIEPFLPFVNHLHFIPGKAPAFYPSLSEDSEGGRATATKVQTAKGIITFSAPEKKPEQEDAKPQYISPQEILNQKIAAEEYYVKVLGGRFSSAYISFTQPDQLLLFSQKFDGKIIESSRGRHYRTVVRLSSIPGAYLEDSLCVSENYVGSLEDSPLFIKWREEERSKEEAKQKSSGALASLTFEQQTELLLEQERQLHPWKYDPSFFQKTPLMAFLAESAQKEAEKQKERDEEFERKQKEAERKKKEKKEKRSAKKKEAKKLATAEAKPSAPKPLPELPQPEPKSLSQSAPRPTVEAPKFKIKPRQAEPPKREVQVVEKPSLATSPPQSNPNNPPLTTPINPPSEPSKQPTLKKFATTSKESKWAKPVNSESAALPSDRNKQPKQKKTASEPPKSTITEQHAKQPPSEQTKLPEKSFLTKPLEQPRPLSTSSAQSEENKLIPNPREQAKPMETLDKEKKPMEKAKKFFTTGNNKPAAS